MAEDNPVNQKLIGIMLKNLGCAVDMVANGKEAVEKITSSHYDLCLMDLQMPVMGGIDATREIRTRSDYRQFPIIALTAAATAEDQAHCKAAGMNAYLTKPIEVERLKEVILEWGWK